MGIVPRRAGRLEGCFGDAKTFELTLRVFFSFHLSYRVCSFLFHPFISMAHGIEVTQSDRDANVDRCGFLEKFSSELNGWLSPEV